MKKLFFIGLAATAMLASCTNDETVDMPQGKAIGFSAFVDKSTRAALDVTTDNLTSFSVYGWRGDEKIFDAQAVKKEGNAWTYTPVQYWVGGANYVFEAVSPAASLTFNAINGASTITFVSDSETDLIYATASKDLSNEDAELTTDPGVVSFTFGHLLSRVKFTFANGFAGDSKAQITVKDVKITNAGSSAVYSKTSGWGTATATSEVSFASDKVANVAATKDAETEHKYLIPSNVKEYELTFTVEMIQGSATTTYNHTVKLPDVTLEAGKSYDFKAELSVENISPEDKIFPIEFTATVTNWEELAAEESVVFPTTDGE